MFHTSVVRQYMTSLSSLHPADGLMAEIIVISLLHFVLLFYYSRVIHHSLSSSASMVMAIFV